MDNITQKRCTKCKQWKLRGEFYVHKGYSDGIATICKVCSNLDGRLRYKANPDKKRNANKEHQKDNPGWWRKYIDLSANAARTKKHYYENREKELDRLRLKDARRRAQTGNDKITAGEWAELKARYDYICLRCRRREPEIKLTLDHVVPLIAGGRNLISNVQPLCLSCNCSKHAKTIDYR